MNSLRTSVLSGRPEHAPGATLYVTLISSFFEEVVKGHDIFTLKDKSGTCIFASDRLVQTINQSKLKGFRFELVWDSEESLEDASK